MKKYYLALGDSITSGYGVGNRSFAVIYYSYLLSFNPYLRFLNYGLNGLTTYGLISMIFACRQVREALAKADIITITIGANDLLKGTAAVLRGKEYDYSYILYHMENNLYLIGLQIRQLNPLTTVKIATIYYPAIPPQLYGYSHQARRVISQANKLIARCAKRYGFNIIPVDQAFSGRERLLIGPDHLHPNLLGHQIIAEECIKS